MINRIRMFILFSAISAGIALAGYGAEEGVTLYVSPLGNDAWSGTIDTPNADQSDGPFGTLEKARDTLRRLRREGKLTQPATVYLRGGVYYLERPLTFTPEDSGTESAPVTFQAYPNEVPVISAGRLIRVKEITREGNLIHAMLPEVKDEGLYFTQVFMNGERRTRARTPNEGFFEVEGELTKEENAQFRFRENHLKKAWAERGDVEWVTLVKWDEHRFFLQDVNEGNQTARVSGKMFEHSNLPDQRYYLENLPEAVNSPGEWYLDRTSGEFIYYPMPGESTENLEFIAPVHEQVVILQGVPENRRYVEYLNFLGLDFAHTAWKISGRGYDSLQAAHTIPGAFLANGANHCRIERCRFYLLGNYAVEFGAGCKYNEIIGNRMTDLAAGGVQIGVPQRQTEEKLWTTHNTISDNTIAQLGRVFHDAVGVLIAQSSNNTVAHNHIYDLYYTAISVGWSWGYHPSNSHHNIIEYNHAHDIGQYLLSDMGAIYLLGPQEGTIVRNNIFHDVYSYDYGGWGLYTDEGSSNILLENNLVYNTKSAGFHQHYGKENVVRNNIFAFGKEYQIMRTREEEHKSFTFEHNIVYFTEGELLGSNWSGNQYEIDSNLYYKVGGEITFKDMTFEQWQEKGNDRHSLIADPLFVNAKEYDFRLKPDSPAERIGFKPFDISEVGPRAAYR